MKTTRILIWMDPWKTSEVCLDRMHKKEVVIWSLVFCPVSHYEFIWNKKQDVSCLL
jgi:hypothetical protein